jgi:hypothetical protein
MNFLVSYTYIKLSFTNNVQFCSFITYRRRVYFTCGYAGMGSMYPHPHPLTRWVHDVTHLCTREYKYDFIPTSLSGKSRRVLGFWVPIAISMYSSAREILLIL